jgi:hypothetical protein
MILMLTKFRRNNPNRNGSSLPDRANNDAFLAVLVCPMYSVTEIATVYSRSHRRRIAALIAATIAAFIRQSVQD